MRPDQVQVHWEEIKVSIYESLPVWSGERGSLMNDILTGILTDQITVWVSYQEVEGVKVIDSIATTTIVANDFAKVKSLLLFTLFGYMNIPEESWIEAFDAMTKHAKQLGCDNIICYSDNEAILEQAKLFKGKMTTMVTFPLGG